MTRTCSLQQPACGGYHHYTLQHCSAAAQPRGLKGRTATALSLDRFNNRFLYAAYAQILDMGGIMKFGPGSGGPRWEVGWFYKIILINCFLHPVRSFPWPGLVRVQGAGQRCMITAGGCCTRTLAAAADGFIICRTGRGLPSTLQHCSTPYPYNLISSYVRSSEEVQCPVILLSVWSKYSD